LSDLVTNTGGVFTVDSSGTLDLTGGDTINNGQLNNAGKIVVSGTGNLIENETCAAVSGTRTTSFTNTGTTEVAGTLTLLSDLVTNTGGGFTVDSSGTLDLTGGDTINNGQLNNAGKIVVSGTGNLIENETGAAVIGTGTNSFTNTGATEVAGTLTLLSDLVTNTGGTLQVDDGKTLTLSGTTINNGTITNVGPVDFTGTTVKNNAPAPAFITNLTALAAVAGTDSLQSGFSAGDI